MKKLYYKIINYFKSCRHEFVSKGLDMTEDILSKKLITREKLECQICGQKAFRQTTQIVKHLRIV